MAKAKKKTTFTVNGRTYPIRQLEFNEVCEFDKMGIHLDELGKMTIASARAYLALYNNGDEDWAGSEIQAHILGGGKLTDITEALVVAINTSDFFQNIGKKPETENQQSESEADE